MGKTVNYARAKAAHFNGSTWTVDVAVDAGSTEHWVPNVVLCAVDRLHCFYIAALANQNYQRTLRASDLTPEAAPGALDTNGTDREIGFAPPGSVYESGGATKVRIAWSTNVDDDELINVVKFDSADTPTESNDLDIAGGAMVWEDTAFIASRFASINDGTTFYVVYINQSDRDLYYDKNVNDGGWGTDTLLVSGTLNHVSINVYTRNGHRVLAYVYDDAGTVKYNELILYPIHGHMTAHSRRPGYRIIHI